MTQRDPMAVLVEHGMLLESAKGPLPNVVALVAGEPVRGSWWSRPDSHEIFEVVNALADSTDVVRTRLVGGKVTLVHRRLWPALVRLADRLPVDRLGAIQEKHTPSGAHRVVTEGFPDWVPEDAVAAAAGLTEEDALALLPACVRPAPVAS